MATPTQTAAHIICLAMLVASCGRPPEGKATSTGTLNGDSFAAVSAVFATNVAPSSFLVDTSGNPSVSGTITSMWISEDPNACYDLQNGTGIGPGLFVALFIADAGTATPASNGMYGITEASSGYEGTTAVVNSDACGSGEFGSDGTISITSMSSAEMVGTFDISFDGGDHTSGTFSATGCPFAVCG